MSSFFLTFFKIFFGGSPGVAVDVALRATRALRAAKRLQD
jgi:hypothetical protein